MARVRPPRCGYCHATKGPWEEPPPPLHGAGAAAAMRILPRAFRRVHIVLDVLDVLAALEHQDLQSLLGELLRSPAPRNTGADYDGVVTLCHESPQGLSTAGNFRYGTASHHQRRTFISKRAFLPSSPRCR